MIAGDPVSMRRLPPRRTAERAAAHAPVGLLLAGAMLFAVVATLAVALLRAH
jgi:hypothetical protein